MTGAFGQGCAAIAVRRWLASANRPTAERVLKDKPITAMALRLFRNEKAVSQIDMAQLMVSANNYTRASAKRSLEPWGVKPKIPLAMAAAGWSVNVDGFRPNNALGSAIPVSQSGPDFGRFR